MAFFAAIPAALKGLVGLGGRTMTKEALKRLLASGLAGEAVGATSKAAINPASFNKAYQALLKKGLSESQARRQIAQNLARTRPEAFSKLTEQFPSFRTQLLKGGMAASGVAGAALTPMFLYQMLNPSAFMPEMEGMEGLMAGGMGGPPTDLESLLGGAAQASEFDTRMEAQRGRGEAEVLNRLMANMSGRVPQRGLSAGLEELIAQNQDRLAKIAMTNRPAFAEIMAREGFYSPSPEQNMQQMFFGGA